jgi:hypothetical protein
MKRFALLAALLAPLTTASLRIPAALGEDGGREAVVPAGQEELLAQMLGKGETLPGDCKLSEGKVDYKTVKATYACSSGDVVFELSHPSQAARDAVRTDRFALTLESGSPPDGLLPALVSHIRSREASFEWKLLEAPPPGAHGSNGILFVVAGLLAIALLGWIVRSRSSARRSGSR